MKLRKRILAILMSILLLLPMVSNQGMLVVKAAAPKGFEVAKEISKDTTTISLASDETATNYVELSSQNGYLYKLEKGTYTMDLQFDENATMLNIILFDDEGRALTEPGIVNKECRILMHEGKYAPAYMMIPSYSQVTATVTVNVTNGIAPTMDTKLDGAIEITETPQSCTANDLQDMSMPNYVRRVENFDDQNQPIYGEGIAWYKPIKAMLYKIDVAAGEECYLEFASDCKEEGHLGGNIKNAYFFYEVVEENGKTTIRQSIDSNSTSVACGSNTVQSLKNSSDKAKTYYVACMPECSISVAKKEVKLLDATISATEITGTCTLKDQTTSPKMYAAVANWVDNNRSIETGYGAFYKLSVPANTDVYVQPEGKVITDGDDQPKGEVITKAIWYNEDQIKNGSGCIMLDDIYQNMFQDHRYTSRKSINTAGNYYLWLYSDTPNQSFNLKVTYQEPIHKSYDKAVQLQDVNSIKINSADGMSNDIPGFIVETNKLDIYKHALLYSIDEKMYDVKFTFGKNLSSMASINIMDKDGNTNGSYVLRTGSEDIQKITHSNQAEKQWFLITGDEDDLNGLEIEVSEVKPLTEDDVNVLTLETEHPCLEEKDKTVKIKGEDYYAYGVFSNSDIRVDVTCDAENPLDYAGKIYVTDLFGNLEYNYDKSSVLNTVSNSSKGGIGNTYRVMLGQSAIGAQPRKLLLIKKGISDFDMSKVKLLATEKQTLSDYHQPEILKDGDPVAYNNNKSCVFNPAYRYTSTDVSDKTLSYVEVGKLFQVDVPAGYSAAVVLKTYDEIDKNIAVYEDLNKHPIQIVESESARPLEIKLPKKNQNQTYYLYAYGGIFSDRGMDIVVDIHDEWRANNTYDRYAVPVDATAQTINLEDLTSKGLKIDKIGDVTKNGTLNSNNTITVGDIGQVVEYTYTINGKQSRLKFVPYVKQSGKDALVKEAEGDDGKGNKVVSSLAVSAEGKIKNKVDETTYNDVTETSKLQLVENKDLLGEVVESASIKLDQQKVSSEDIKKMVEVTVAKNAAYTEAKYGPDSKIAQVEATFTDNTSTDKISEEAFTAMRDANVDMQIAKQDADGNDEYVWSFAHTLLQADSKSVNPVIEVKDSDTQVDELVEQVASDSKTTVLDFKNSGVLPGTAKVKIAVSGYAEGAYITCYYYDEANSQLTEPQKVQLKDGYVTISIEHCSQYVLCSGDVAQTVPVESVTLSETTVTLTVGETKTLVPTVLPETATNKEVTWTSGDASVASVGEDGKITALKEGSTTITATAKDGSEKSASCTVTVNAAQQADPQPQPEPTPGSEPTPQPQTTVTPAVTASYRTHVQSFGWQGVVQNGAISGTSGKSKRLEAIEISLAGNSNLGIQYTTHCQSYGWLPWSANGEMNGTEGESKRLEAIKIQLTGADKDKYDVYYRVHAQTFGWLGWAKNGSPAGTAGLSKRLEAIQIVVVKKGEGIDTRLGGIVSARNEAYISNSTSNPTIPGDTTPNVAYKTHVQTFGWQGWRYNGAMAGTSGKSKRLEGINIKLSNKPYSGGIVYTTHVQTFGWQGDVNNPATWKRDGEMAGTSGKSKRLEAICIKLTGEMEKHYDVYYRVHAQTFGWLAWTKNGAQAGTAGLSKRLEGIQIVLVPKGGAAPANDYGGIKSGNTRAFISK